MAKRKGRGPGYQMATRIAPPRRVSGNFDWIASAASVDSAGTPQTTTSILTSWGKQGNFSNPSNLQAVLIQPTPASTTPGIGRLRVDEIRGCVQIGCGAGASGQFNMAVGIYVSDINNTTTKWNVRDVSNVAEANRDDYLYLEGKSANLSPGSADVANSDWMEFELRLSQPVIIGGGQCLMVSIYPDASNTVAYRLATYFRTRVGPVA